MSKLILTIIFLSPASSVLAHVGEEVEEHAGDAVQAGPAMGSLVLGGVLAATVVGFLIWVMVKK